MLIFKKRNILLTQLFMQASSPIHLTKKEYIDQNKAMYAVETKALGLYIGVQHYHSSLYLEHTQTQFTISQKLC
jgi:hypothetical protein